MVVDDQDANAHGIGTSAATVVPDPTVDSTAETAPTSADALAHSHEPEDVVPCRVPVEAPAVVLDDRRDGSVTAGQAGCSRATRPRA